MAVKNHKKAIICLKNEARSEHFLKQTPGYLPSGLAGDHLPSGLAGDHLHSELAGDHLHSELAGGPLPLGLAGGPLPSELAGDHLHSELAGDHLHPELAGDYLHPGLAGDPLPSGLAGWLPELQPDGIGDASTNRFRIALILFILSVLLIAVVAILSVGFNRPGNLSRPDFSTILAVSYLEDPQGIFSLRDIAEAEVSLDSGSPAVNWQPGQGFKIGNSRSVWWVRIKTDDILSANKEYGTKGDYFSILTSSVERVALYLPESSGNLVNYQVYHAGWGIPYKEHDDIGFSYPTFMLAKEIPPGQYAYLRMSSIYTQNYTFKIYSDSSFQKIDRIQTSMVALFIGFMVAIGISNFIQFSSLQIAARLYYILYLLSLILYTGSVLGFFRLYLGKAAEYLVAGIAPAGMFMMISALLFFRAILGTKQNFPLAHKATIGAILFFLLAFIAFLLGFRYEANLMTLLLANLSSLLILFTTFLAIRKKYSQAKYLFAGWALILLVSLVFNARAIGLLPNQELTSFVILFPTLIEAVLLSLGMSEMTDQIQREKEHALRLYQHAEGQVLTKESAFLQAQIKPHFLYNALNVIEALCYIDGRKAGDLIQELSKFLRHGFDFRNLNSHIDFNEELEYIKAYVKIEQSRFPDKIHVAYDLEDVEGLTVPPLILQPLIENAIKHGIRESGRKGKVVLRLRRFENTYRITVEDDGVGMTEDQISQALAETFENQGGVGLANISKRLRMFYGTELQIESAPGRGTKVTIELPKQWENHS